MRFYRDFVSEVSDDLTTIVQYRTLPPLAIFPPEFHGRKVLQIGVVWAGSMQEGQRMLAPLRTRGNPLFDLVAPRPYVAMQAANDKAVPHGWHYYFKSMNVGRLSAPMIDLITMRSLAMRSPRSFTIIFQLGGAVGRRGEDAAAYSHRAAGHNINVNGVWLPDEDIGEQETRWTRDLYDALRPYQAGVYVNFLMDEGQERIRQAYGPAKFKRPVALKDRLDPDNVFRMNQNVMPSGR